MVAASQPRLVRFGAFELDLHSGELRRAGLRVSLSEQPFRVLSCLVQHPGTVVTREDLRKQLWPADTFVDFEHGLNVAIRRVRDALGDDAEAPRFVETLPKRGYRFVAPVSYEAAGLQQAPPAGTGPGSRRRRWAYASAATVAAIALVGVAATFLPGRPILTDRDRILVEDFVNKTGDDAFDHVLRQGVVVQLEQSPFFATISRERVRQTLRQMTRSPDEEVSGPVAQEVCLRAGAKVRVGGSITRLGQHYVIAVEAVDCASGETVATEQAEASGREQVHLTLGATASRLRRRLGESRRSIEAYDVPLSQGTTGSLEALKYFSSAMAERNRGQHAAAVPLLKRAVELDPEFALAWAHLNSALSIVGKRDEADEALARAFAKRERVSEQERYYISHRYFVMTGDLQKATENSEAWARVYRRNWLPHDNLCKFYWQAWKTERALAECRQALSLEPSVIGPSDALASFNIALGRLSDAREAAKGLLATGLNDALAHGYLAQIAWLEPDAAALQQELAWLSANEVEVFKDLQYQRSLAAGKLREAAAIRPVDGSVLAFVGRGGEARARAESRLREWHARSPSSPPPIDALFAMAMTGDAAWLETAETAARALPRHFILNDVIRPRARAALELSRGNGRRAVELLEAARQYGFGVGGFTATYVRGLAFLQDRQARNAAGEFDQIIAHRGVEPGNVLWPLAHLGLARSLALAGDDSALKAYERFLALWSEADDDLPVLREARREHERLSSARPES